MPKRKRLPNYTGIKNTKSGCIQKSRPLQTLSETSLTLPEFKILDIYLSRINSHRPEKRTVKFEKGELERCLGVSRILKDDLDKRLRNLFQVVEVKDERKRKGFKLINLFEEADAEPDENGLWQITLTCTASAREYVFNIDNIGYLRYRLKNVINLTSRYSYILFLYLVDNKFRKTWQISLVELKKLLNCSADSYNQFKRFNDLILKKCQKEINEKTDLKFEYSSIKKGRRVAEIEFTVQTVNDLIEAETEIAEDDGQLPGQISLFEDGAADEDGPVEPEEIDYGGELANLLGEAACDNEFTPEQIRIIQDLVIKAVPQGDDIKRCDYLIEKIHKMNYYNPSREQRFSYLCKMLENEIR